MAGYLVVNIEVKDPVKFQEYREKVAPLIAKFGGRYLIRGGELRRLEGNPQLNRLVVVEFPSIATAEQFYKHRISADFKAPAGKYQIRHSAGGRLFGLVQNTQHRCLAALRTIAKTDALKRGSSVLTWLSGK